MSARLRSALLAACVIGTVGLPGISRASFVVFSAGGDDTVTSIQPTVDAFRVALGDPNNGNAAGPLTTGRREINWDGGGATTSSPGPTPFTVFFNNRGAGITTPGTGFLQTPLDSAANAPELADLNPSYVGPDSPFNTFSPLRIFTPVGSNITDVSFIVPGSAPTNVFGTGIPATVSGFGAVFTDVDLSDTTTIQLFGLDGGSLGSFSVAAGSVSSGSLSFLGLIADAGERIARVRITTGTTALGPNDDPTAGVDVVVMDDFLYAEPQAVPEPSSLILAAVAGVGTLSYGWLRRKRT